MVREFDDDTFFCDNDVSSDPPYAEELVKSANALVYGMIWEEYIPNEIGQVYLCLKKIATSQGMTLEDCEKIAIHENADGEIDKDADVDFPGKVC